MYEMNPRWPFRLRGSGVGGRDVAAEKRRVSNLSVKKGLKHHSQASHCLSLAATHTQAEIHILTFISLFRGLAKLTGSAKY